MTASAVLEVLDGLHAAFLAATAEGQVFYGPAEDSQWTGQVGVWVAVPDGDNPPVTVQAEPFRESGDQRLRVTVDCAFRVSDGGKDVRATLVRAADLEQALRDSVLSDRTLDGVAENAEFGTTQQYEIARDQGVTWLCLFQVEVTTWSR